MYTRSSVVWNYTGNAHILIIVRVEMVGHLYEYRMEVYRMIRRIFEWRTLGKRSRGRPRNRWRDDVLKKVKNTGCEKLSCWGTDGPGIWWISWTPVEGCKTEGGGGGGGEEEEEELSEETQKWKSGRDVGFYLSVFFFLLPLVKIPTQFVSPHIMH